MKLRHAAALALVGWYLLVPLPNYPVAPMKYGGHFGSYDTAKECGDVQLGLIQKSGQSNWNAPPGEYSTEQLKAAYKASECIEADDPRLRDN